MPTCEVTRQSIPEVLWPTDRAFTFVSNRYILETIKWVLFEVSFLEGRNYEGLREQISSVLQETLLLCKQQQAEAALKQAYAWVEKDVKVPQNCNVKLP